ncbi:hypothetical protein GLX30_07105 [Streptomyces sp. Tu 2975]|uniref:hypothetical protein n=1 Tax=Streptomyces sp. Tu 2975 TaxID=2676871 RepID=UPI00135BE242|nr:hypothetical protein [Streptomyces sp. Tu 2975]QIP83866.1 hypothetical protein GLX30_07105 [Streptomyces sp. Tu 2975]
MAKKPKSSQPPQGEGPSRHQGGEHHGWSPDVDGTSKQDNPSARRSFHAEEHAGSPGEGRKVSKEEKGSVPGDTVKSETGSGEEYGGDSENGMRDTGRKGRSQRPSGTKDDSAFTGVDPDEPGKGERRPG